MGAPSDNDPDRNPDPEAPVDDGWTTGSEAHNDRTTAGLAVDPAALDRLTAGIGKRFAVTAATPRTIAKNPHNDETRVGPGTEPNAGAASEDSRISALDQTMAELERSEAESTDAMTALERSEAEATDTVAKLERSDDEVDADVIANAKGEADHDRTVAEPARFDIDANDDRPIAAGPRAEPSVNDRTQAGMGVVNAAARARVVTPAPRPGLALMQPGKGTIPLEKERALVQPERSPLDFVMRDLDPAAPVRSHSSGDSSRFISTLVGDQPPPRVGVDTPATAMEPVLRRSRLRRYWIMAGAFAATAVLGTAFAMKLIGSDKAAATAASESASEAAQVAANPANAAPTASNAETPSNADTPNTDDTPSNAEASNAAAAADPAAAAKPTVQPTVQPTVPPTVEATIAAGPEPRAKQDVVALATTQPVTKAAKPLATSAKPATAKKTVATKDTTAKKPTAAKESSSAKKKSTATKSIAKTSSTTKKPSADKKATTAKKPVTAKKTTAQKPATAKQASSAKKPSAAKKPSTAKKTTTAKKRASKQSPRSQRSGRRTRRS